MAVLVALVAAGATADPLIRSPDASDTIDIVTHVDILPDDTVQARDAVASYVHAARAEPGALRVDALQEMRQNHFDLIETWRDEAAWRAHQSSAATLAFRRTIGAWLASPLDERIGTPVP